MLEIRNQQGGIFRSGRSGQTSFRDAVLIANKSANVVFLFRGERSRIVPLVISDRFLGGVQRLCKVNVQLRFSQLQSLATTRILGFDHSGEVQCPESWSWTREKYCSVMSNQDSILKPGNEVGICCSNKNQFVHAVQIPVSTSTEFKASSLLNQ